MADRTSNTHPLRIDVVSIPATNGQIGTLSHQKYLDGCLGTKQKTPQENTVTDSFRAIPSHKQLGKGKSSESSEISDYSDQVR